MSLSGNDQQKLEEIAKKPYKDQAIWFLNAFWEDHGEKEAETLWKQAIKFGQLDPNGKDGHELDEMQAHRFLEAFKETHTVRDLRDKLRAKGAINEKVKTFPMIHYLAIRYNVDWHKLVNAPQGGGKEVFEATRRLEEAQAACQAAEQSATEARHAEQEAKTREASAIKRENEGKQAEATAKKRESEAKEAEAVAKHREAESKAKASEAAAREADLVAAKRELEAALAELKKEEDAYNNKTATLKKQSEEGSVVQRNRAVNELAQHLAQETLTLRRAKISQEAAVRKADKAAQAASESRAVAEKAASEATAARKQAEDAAHDAAQARAQAEESARQAAVARKEAEAAAREAERASAEAARALDEAQQKLQEAEEYLESIKNAIGQGAAWWIDREIHEARAFLPQAKGGYKKPV